MSSPPPPIRTQGPSHILQVWVGVTSQAPMQLVGMIFQHTKIQNIPTYQNTKWKSFSHNSNISTYTVGKSRYLRQFGLKLKPRQSACQMRWEWGNSLNVRQWEDNVRQWDENGRHCNGEAMLDNGKTILDNCNGEEAEKWRKCSAEINRVVHSVILCLIQTYFISCLT